MNKTNSVPGDATTTVTITPGEAGGTVERTFTKTATVRAIDPSTRRINLTGTDGTSAELKAGPEVRNFDQIRVGDKVSATVVEKLYVFVHDGDDPNSVTHAAILSRMPQGAKPGALVGSAYEVVATIRSLDPAAHKATLEFADGSTTQVTPRADVDMTKYHAGQKVVIQVSQVLGMVVESPQ